jgi:hypothetical protein
MYRGFSCGQLRAGGSSNQLMRVSNERILRAIANHLCYIEELPGVITARIGTRRRRADLY